MKFRYDKAALMYLNAAFSVSGKRLPPLSREGNFGQPEVVRSCKELILQAKSMTRPAGKAGRYEGKWEGLLPLRHLPGVFRQPIIFL